MIVISWTTEWTTSWICLKEIANKLQPSKKARTERTGAYVNVKTWITWINIQNFPFSIVFNMTITQYRENVTHFIIRKPHVCREMLSKIVKRNWGPMLDDWYGTFVAWNVIQAKGLLYTIPDRAWLTPQYWLNLFYSY